MSNTNDNLQEAFAGESQASRKYLYFAEKADKEGQKYIARLFRAASDAETAHARNHLKVMGGIKSTADNLRSAIDGENHEFTKMYPDFIEVAGNEVNKAAADTFDLANRVEQIHHTLYSDALARLEKSEDIENKPIYVCQYCGNTVVGEAPDKCPICGAPIKLFKLID
ncbi:rubrerythrin family protein [Chloroflexota bacterium]